MNLKRFGKIIAFIFEKRATQFNASLRPFIFRIHISCSNTQNKSIAGLINKEDPGWVLVQDWQKKATNKVEFLPKDSARAANTLYQVQVTTRSPMGAIIYESGGILVNNGWIRILGSGHTRLNRTLSDWNLGKSYEKWGERPSFLLIADDVLGGFFAINAGEFGQNNMGKIFYLAPDTLEWELLNMTYTDFIIFCFSGDIKTFYKSYYWAGWEKDIAKINGNQGVSCFPYLFTEEGRDINKVNRDVVPIEELWILHNQLRNTLFQQK